jgi:UDP-glucose 4-epimerase
MFHYSAQAIEIAMILVTGGAGYIGSHICVELLNHGYQVIVVDNLVNSDNRSLQQVEKICGCPLVFRQADVRDQPAIEAIIRSHAVRAVIHLAGLKGVGDSFANPLDYYDNNVVGTLRLIAAMQRTGVRTFVFSSSATVYGIPESLPLTEDHPLAPVSPYARSKLMCESVLRDHFLAEPESRIAMLRYFNPAGAHSSGLIGENSSDGPNNLVPLIGQVTTGKKAQLNIWGSDYSTPDGTGIRDYIHVADLARGHVQILERLKAPGVFAMNLGTGRGSSVLEVIKAFEAASGCKVPFAFGPRRDGDVASYYADIKAAERLFGWTAERTLLEMCADHWRWQQNYPNGFGDRD